MTIINIVGRDFLLEQNFNRVTQLVKFLAKLETDDSNFYESHEELNHDYIRRESKKIRVFRERLVSEFSRIEDTPGGSASKPQHSKDKFTLKLSMLEHVNQLAAGYSFGEVSLISGKPCNATCYVMSEKVRTAELTKKDFDKVLAERQR